MILRAGARRTRRAWSGFAAALAAAAMFQATAGAQRQAVPLNDYARLGQRFTEARPFSTLWVSVPSWLDSEGGLTLSLWDAPERKRLIQRRAYADVSDNAAVELAFRTPIPAGTYYWEVDSRTGSTRVGLYADPLAADSDDCAYLDGVPNRRLRFVYGTNPTALRNPGVVRLLAVLRSGSAQEKRDACRMLAVSGDRRAAPELARLLRDPELGHMARLALETVPGPEAAAALRQAANELKGDARIGAINSVGARRDRAATPLLRAALLGADRAAASAAAAALGRIGTPEAGEALAWALRKARGAGKDSIAEGALDCADRLMAAGRTDRARALFDALAAGATPVAIRAAAARGAIVARGASGIGMLVDRLRSPDTSMFRAGLWVLQRDLPGAAVTRAAVGILPTLPAERRALVVAALGPRGDASATEAIAAHAAAGNKDVRTAAVGALVALKNRSAIATLVRLIADPNDEVARAAQDGLASLSDADVAASAQSLLSAQDPRARVAEVTLVARRRLAGFSAKLLAAARDADPDVRAAAMKALATQSGPEALPGLLDMLASGIASQEAAGVEAAVAAVCSRMPAAEATSSVRARLAGAGPAARCAIIRVLGGVGSGDALQAVLSALHDDGEAVRRVAAESVQGWPTADAVPDLLRLARSAPDTAHRLPFLRGLLRIAAGAEMPSDARLTICREAIPMVERDEEKRTLLAALSATGLLDAVPLIEPHLDHAPVRAEACAAVLAIAERISGRPWPGAVAAALEKVSRMSADPDTVRRARALL